MGWITDHGEHEGWVGALFADGTVGGTWSADGIRVSYTADGRFIDDVDEWRPQSAVVGWVGMCDCPARWRGTPWTRVHNAADEDLSARRAYSEDADQPKAVEEDVYTDWRRHIEPDMALQEIADLVEQRNTLDEKIARKVAAARRGQVSWAAIGQAAGMTRQSAHERWKNAG